ncbi:MAG: tetratricopeptide repeat protein [Acidobacteria bacterium]|nr:tetratricopeptide repeat protein [Acidobacteriota bacterium]MBV9924600.1 tetratricopeptide repeat protein [Acidobacteriota bacterium]
MHTPQRALRLAAALALTLATLAPALAAQKAQDDPERQRAFELFQEQQFAEALAPLEKLAARYPGDGEVLARFGLTLFVNTISEPDSPQRLARRARARAAVVRARELGFDAGVPKDLIDQLIAGLKEDGSSAGGPNATKFSDVPEADTAMRAGEAAFMKNDYDAALAAYEKALALDPKLYEAPLFAGDVFLQKGQFEKAGEWYARAIKLDPDREQAYRYWGNSLLKQARLDEARDKYVEAVVANPYDRYTWENGLFRWANAKAVRLGHPKIDVQSNFSQKDGRNVVTLDPKAGEKPGDGSAAWAAYGLLRAAWALNDYEKFKQAYPGEKAYRHSLREEAGALRGVIEAVRNQQKAGEVKQLSKDLQLLVQLEEAGLLEAYVLFARTDQGIAQDYVEYRKANRDKLRRYLTEYLASGKY